MTAKYLLAAILAIAFCVTSPAADQRDVRNILEKYDALRPPAESLAIYQLDWAPTLKEAQIKAAKEGRPILLVFVTNSFGDICSGHC